MRLAEGFAQSHSYSVSDLGLDLTQVRLTLDHLLCQEHADKGCTEISAAALNPAAEGPGILRVIDKYF